MRKQPPLAGFLTEHLSILKVNSAEAEFRLPNLAKPYIKRKLPQPQLRKAKLFAAFALLTFALASGANVSHAETNWASTLSVFDITGNSSLQPSDPLLAGHAYNLTLQIVVPFTQASSQFFPALNGRLLGHGAQFWYVKTPQYAGYNASSFVPGSRTLTFSQVAGTLVLSSIFEVPADLTIVGSANFTRHLTASGFILLAVTVTGGSTVGQITANIEDQTIQTFLTTYQAKSTLISSGKIDQAYSTLVNGVLAEAQTLYSLGLPDQGTNLLGTIDPASFPAPPSTTMSTTLLVGVVVAVIIIALLAVLVLRGRGKSGFAAGIVNEVQKELAILEVTAAKYDKQLADRLQALRNKLGETD